MSKEIQLTKGKIAIVDDEDFEEVSKHSWNAFSPNGKPDYFVARRILWINRKRINLYLHRFLLNAPKGVLVDHKNGNPLDNRRCNLRLASRSQNRANSSRKSNNKTGFKGLRATKNNKFDVAIKFNGKDIYCGRYDSAAEAAVKYDQKAKELFGEFACLNFPDNQKI